MSCTPNMDRQSSSRNSSTTPNRNLSSLANTSSTPDIAAASLPNITSPSPSPSFSTSVKSSFSSSITDIKASSLQTTSTTSATASITIPKKSSLDRSTTPTTGSSPPISVFTTPPLSPQHVSSSNTSSLGSAIEENSIVSAPHEQASRHKQALFKALQDLPLARISPQDPELHQTPERVTQNRTLNNITKELLWLSHSGDWESNFIRLWADNGSVFKLEPYKLDRECVTSFEDPGIHHLLRNCIISSYDKDFPFTKGEFLIVPLGKLLLNQQPTSWIVVFGEDKRYWLLRDEVKAYLVGSLDGGRDDWYEDDPNDWYPEDVGEEMCYAQEVEVFGDFNIARVGEVAKLDEEPQGSSKTPPNLQLYAGDWKTLPVP